MKSKTKLLTSIIAIALSVMLLFTINTVCSNIKEFTSENTFVYGWIV